MSKIHAALTESIVNLLYQLNVRYYSPMNVTCIALTRFGADAPSSGSTGW
jgi:hypothetical protein